MNYYPFHIGDFRSGTAHLSDAEELAYRRLLDWYYDTEKPLPLDISDVALIVRMPKDVVASVLQDFFCQSANGWINIRCDKEISDYREAKANHWTCLLTPAQKSAMQAARNASKANATPKWLTAQDKRDIEAIYQQARDLTASTGIPHEVDHIVPLRNKTVCGLHVSWNLRAIPAHENRTKSNAWEVV